MSSLMIDTVRIFESAPEKIVKAGEVIFKPGDNDSHMFGIIAGEVELSVNGHPIETLDAGNIFGVGAIIHEDHSRASTAIAKTDCKIAEMNREHFFFAIQQTPMFALEVMRSYSDRFRNLKMVHDALLSSQEQG
ncbi:MAG: cyclic nucleotide-binding domain-containing protein [Synechocystis sp.]|nr:cyclic nucleotide-binding domain-containing protein [Synechocystis sp.]